MREYLFRGKRTYDGNWVYGNLIRDDCKNVFIIPQSDFYVDGHHLYYYDESDTPVFIDEYTIGEYTGLLDRNGNKVFEGDILRIYKNMSGMDDYYYPPLEYPELVVVRWDMCAWTWETLTEDKYYIHFPDAWCHYECEVIGNEFDNPELMKEVK